MSNWFDAYLQETEHIRDNYNQARALFGCPVDGTEPAKIAGIPYRMFTSQGQFKLFESAPADWRKKAHCQWKSVIVDLDDIYFFAKEGELTTNITASGGGSDIGRAIIGGILAGNAGAIIASRKETKVETTTIDTRKTVLYYKGGQLTFAPGDYAALMKLIPDKEISAVQRIAAQKAVQQSTANTATDRLRSLKEMLDADLITSEEYEAKKAKILEDL
mgnify:CR=1 FL=1